MGINKRVLVSALARASSAELSESQVIAETLRYTLDDEAWKMLFRVMIDNEIHRDMIYEMVEALGYSVQSFEEKYLRQIEVKKYDFSGDFIKESLNEILTWEIWTERYYSQLSEMDLSGPSIDGSAANEIRDKLRALTKWESKHIEILKKLLSEL